MSAVCGDREKKVGRKKNSICRNKREVTSNSPKKRRWNCFFEKQKKKGRGSVKIQSGGRGRGEKSVDALLLKER